MAASWLLPMLLLLLRLVVRIHRRLRSDYLSSDPWKNYPSATEGIFGFSWITLSTDAKERAGFPSSLASRAPRSEADFSTLKFQLLFIRLSQDLVSVDIFENEDHLEYRIKIFSLFLSSNSSKHVNLQNHQNMSIYKIINFGRKIPRFWISVYFLKLKPPWQKNQTNLIIFLPSNVLICVKFT